MGNKQLKYVIFDMDGTLVDSETIYLEGWKQAFYRQKIPISDKIIENWRGKSALDTTAEIDAITQCRKKTIELRAMRRHYFSDALLKGKVRLKEYGAELITFCKDKNLIVGLNSSSFTADAAPILKHLELYDAFDLLVFGDDVENCKPAPDSYELAVEKAGVEKAECLVIEDSESGFMSAIQAELRVIYMPDFKSKASYFHPDIYQEVKTLKEVVPFIEGLL